MRPVHLALAGVLVVSAACSVSAAPAGTPATGSPATSAAPSADPAATASPSAAALAPLPLVAPTGRVATDAPFDLVAAFGSMWIVDNLRGTVSRVDPATNKVVATIVVSTFVSSVTAAPDGIWVIDGGAQGVARIDPKTNRITQRYPIEGGDGGSLGYTDGLLWHNANSDGSTLVALDPATGKQTDHAAPDGCAGGFTMSSDAIYVGGNGAICRLDPSFKLTAEYQGDVAGGALALGAGQLWALTSNGDIAVIDPVTMKLVRTILQGAGGTYQGGTYILGRPNENIAIAVDAKGAWVRLSATTIGRVTLGASPELTIYAGLPDGSYDGTPIAEGFGSLWVTSTDTHETLRLPQP